MIAVVILVLALCVFVRRRSRPAGHAEDWERRQYDAESHRRLLRELDRQP